jgi:hypothetical protein
MEDDTCAIRKTKFLSELFPTYCLTTSLSGASSRFVSPSDDLSLARFQEEQRACKLRRPKDRINLPAHHSSPVAQDTCPLLQIYHITIVKKTTTITSAPPQNGWKIDKARRKTKESGFAFAGRAAKLRIASRSGSKRLGLADRDNEQAHQAHAPCSLRLMSSCSISSSFLCSEDNVSLCCCEFGGLGEALNPFV